MPVSIVRPSIIESALAEPFPGWIRGFRMAEPVILSYARGLLKEFPGVPEGTVDVIPVDIVVAAIIAVAAVGPERGAAHHAGRQRRHQPAQVPARWSTTSAPGSPSIRCTTPRASRSSCPSGSSRLAAGCKKQLKRAKTMAEHGRAGAAGASAARQAGRRGRPSSKRRKTEIERAYQYVQLYGLYTECEAIYQVDNLMRIHGTASTPTTGDAFNFDPRSVDWPKYVNTIHLPSIVQHARAKTDAGQEPQRPHRPAAPQRARRPTAMSPRSISRTR